MNSIFKLGAKFILKSPDGAMDEIEVVCTEDTYPNNILFSFKKWRGGHTRHGYAYKDVPARSCWFYSTRELSDMIMTKRIKPVPKQLEFDFNVQKKI